MEIKQERLSAEEYIDFLKRSDLGSQYPKERFRERIEKTSRSASSPEMRKKRSSA